MTILDRCLKKTLLSPLQIYYFLPNYPSFSIFLIFTIYLNNKAWINYSTPL